MKLNDWKVYNEDGVYIVEHYVGGEDGHLFDSEWFTQVEAITRQAILNVEAREYTHLDPFHQERQQESDYQVALAARGW